MTPEARAELARRKRSIFWHDFAQVERDIKHYLDEVSIEDMYFIEEQLRGLKHAIYMVIYKEEECVESRHDAANK